jgi:TonB family protein
MLKALVLGSALLLTASAQDAPAPATADNKAPDPAKAAPDTSTADKPLPKMVRVSAKVAQTHLEKQVPPRYPARAKADIIQGTVEMKVLIGTDGSVTDIQVVHSPRNDLSESAVAAVKQWKYKPFTIKGVAIPTETTINVNFILAQ